MTPRSITFRVDGEPQPFPKKELNFKTKVMYSRDRGGKKAAWAEKIRIAAYRELADVEGQRWQDVCGPLFSRPIPVEIEIWLYRTKPKSNKQPYPTTRPDLDNLCYTPHNVLQGIFYDDDSQIIDLNEHKRWADISCPPCMIITITEVCGE